MSLHIKPLFQHRHYPNPPIQEALIDFRMQLAPGITAESMLRLHGPIRDRYPQTKKRLNYSAQLSAGERVAASAKQLHTGFSFHTADERYVFQARTDGFTFSRLAPYESWEELIREARQHWDQYSMVVSPYRISRVAVRYINLIRVVGLSAASVDLDQYFLTAPRIGPGLPQTLEQFLMQLAMPQPDIEAAAVVTHSIGQRTDGAVPFILDIDVFKEVSDPVGISEREAWETLELLRIRKNDLFEGSITDQARELFK